MNLILKKRKNQKIIGMRRNIGKKSQNLKDHLRLTKSKTK